MWYWRYGEKVVVDSEDEAPDAFFKLPDGTIAEWRVEEPEPEWLNEEDVRVQIGPHADQILFDNEPGAQEHFDRFLKRFADAVDRGELIVGRPGATRS